MYYAIDFDSRSVESKSMDEEMLSAYIVDNNLSDAVALISSAEELCFEFSLNEMSDVYGLLNGNPPKFSDEEEAADAVWETLEEHQDDFPTFTPALGKKLLKAADKSSDAKPKAPAKAKTKSAKAPSKRRPKLEGAVFTIGDEPPMKGRHADMVAFVDDNFGEATYEELCEFLESHKGRPDEHISFAIRKGFLKVEEEL